ncbi:MAG: hypothetical protein U5R06_24130 [candidate division KSB1 bacterium]|nr:hypothetical protein [candidate division KSB1 bacterium]
MKRSVLTLFVLLLTVNIVRAQSGQEFRRSSIMRGNLVKCVFGNWGVLGQPATKGARGAWIYENNGYIGDVSPMVGAEITVDGKTFHSVEICPAARPSLDAEVSPSNKPWGFEPKAGYFNESQQGVALYSDPASWPAFWPDKMDDPEDPGWSGSWNGFAGKTTTASEETYFVMDDNNDEEFNFADNNVHNVAFKPDSTNPSRNGLGLEVRVRGMQWSDFLAQDCIFWLYEITNTSKTDYDKAVFAMLVGTYVGVTSTEDFGEYNDDYSFFDVERDLTYTADFDNSAKRNPNWTGDVGVVGYAFLESPGNPYDGIDNDGDAADNPLVPVTAPLFGPEDFEPRVIEAGDPIVLIDKDYNRTVITVGSETQTVMTRGDTIVIEPGVTELAEGNEILVDGRNVINPNVYDGIDNDLDGLIDENYYLHYRQIRKDGQGNVLIDKLAPVHHVDYINGVGLDDLMIDERRDDGIDNDGDWNSEFDDVGADGIPNTGDRGEGDGIPTLGEPNFDKTDVEESDQIGLTSFEYFTPAGDINLADDESLWERLRPGYFEVPSSIVNNKPERGEDGDFLYSSGYFPLRAGETKYFSLALVYGEGGGPEVDIDDLLKNRETVQKIYNSDYNFPPPPETPTLTAVPGDGKVTLYWDRIAEKSFDPVLKTFDFEGYKIYKATDHNFNEVFTITDMTGTPSFYEPLAQFDLKNGIKGFFHPSFELLQNTSGSSFDLGNDTGLQHSYTDYDVENGQRYFYAVVAYDHGDTDIDIFPKENSKRIDIAPSGEVRTFQNTAVVTPNAQAAGYEAPDDNQLLSAETVGTGSVSFEVVDDQALKGHTYEVSFLDTGNDGLDNDGDWDVLKHDVGSDGVAGTDDPDGTEQNGLPDPGEPNVDQNDPDEYFVPKTRFYHVKDNSGVETTFQARDTLWVSLAYQNIIPSSVVLRDEDGKEVSKDLWELNATSGRIRGVTSGDLKYGKQYTLFFQYYPVYRSPYMQNSPWVNETKDTDVFDGVQLEFNNHWQIVLDTTRTYWTNRKKAYNFSIEIINTNIGSEQLIGYRHPSNYQIEFYDSIVDSSADLPEYFVTPIPVNFRIRNTTDDRYIDFVFNDTDRSGGLSRFDELIFLEAGHNDSLLFTWDMYFTSTKDTVYTYDSSDTLFVRFKKPFRASDSFEFTTKEPKIVQSEAKTEMDNIKAVPNPYVVATTQEPPLPPAITSGRGTRKIDFIHLPVDAQIHIFTSRGDHVVTLQHDGSIYSGTLSWNLKTKENLDVAPGVYFYVVESNIGVKRGKLAIIK